MNIPIFTRPFMALAGIVMLLVLIVPDLASGQAQRTLRDWQVNCDQAGKCSAETSATGRTDAVTYRFTLVFSRENRDAAWRVVIRMQGAQPARTSALILQIDDGSHFRFRPDEIIREGREYELTGAPKIDALMTAFQDGNRLWLTFHNPRIRETGLAFSLSGVVASIIWIDEQQLSEPVAVVAEIPDRIIRLQAFDDYCDPTNLPDSFVPESHQLSDQQWLHIMPCAVGAYSAISRLYLENRQYDEIHPLHFATFSEDFGWGGTNILIDIEFDPATQILTSLARGRGLGDCGSLSKYIWQDYDFKLLEFRHWESCDGTHMPADWPIIYSAEK